jgi:hypothetical protein
MKRGDNLQARHENEQQDRVSDQFAWVSLTPRKDEID